MEITVLVASTMVLKTGLTLLDSPELSKDRGTLLDWLENFGG